MMDHSLRSALAAAAVLLMAASGGQAWAAPAGANPVGRATPEEATVPPPTCSLSMEDEDCPRNDKDKSHTTGSLCLNMIVKNEVKVLPRLLPSVQKYVDHYVIVDTGSSDDTIGLINRTMEEFGVPGEVHERPWVNFGVNRQQALDLAVEYGHCDWLLFIDADEELALTDPDFRQKLVPGTSYYMSKRSDGQDNFVLQIIDLTENTWKWEGVVHNYLSRTNEDDSVAKKEILKDVWIIYHEMQGAKSHGVTPEEKFLRDAKLLEEELAKNPNDSRSMFYLGQSYKDAGHPSKAYEAYKKRANMANTWDEEIFYSLLMAGILGEQIHLSEEQITGHWLAAWGVKPERAEPLYYLAEYYRKNRQYEKAYSFARAGLNLSFPLSNGTVPLFPQKQVYDWLMLDEVCTSAYYVKKHKEGGAACQEILDRAANNEANISDYHLDRIRESLAFYR